MAGRQKHKDERAKHLEAIGQAPLPLPSERRSEPIPYTPDLDAEALDLAACGLSETEIAAHWAIDAQTMSAWREGHPSFGATMSRARVAAEAWWEEKARRALELRDNRFPAGAWAMVMKARFSSYREQATVNFNIDLGRLVMLDLRPELPSEQGADGPSPLIEGQTVGLGGSRTARRDPAAGLILMDEGQAGRSEEGPAQSEDGGVAGNRALGAAEGRPAKISE